jgi:hypothetical protein
MDPDCLEGGRYPASQLLLDSKSAKSPMPQTTLNMNFCGKILKMKTRVTVKKKKKMMMTS